MTHSSWGKPGLTKSDLYRVMGVDGLPIYVNSKVGLIHQDLANNLKNLRAQGAPSLSSSGGYVKRYISGTTTWSNHAWGLAVDYNAPTNPYKYGGTTDFRVADTHAFLKKYLGKMRWGYDYTGKKDAMHFEWIGSTLDAAVTTAQLQKGTTSLAVSYGVGSVGKKVLEIECRLLLLGYLPSTYTVGEKYTQQTASAVLAFQERTWPNEAKEHDGLVGPKTLQALERSNLGLKVESVLVRVGNLRTNETLRPGQSVVSPDQRNRLSLQADGNLVHYGPTGALWSTMVRGNILEMQPDGNLVLSLEVAGHKFPVWSTNSAGAARDMRLEVQNDSNLVLYGTRAFWHTN